MSAFNEIANMKRWAYSHKIFNTSESEALIAFQYNWRRYKIKPEEREMQIIQEKKFITEIEFCATQYEECM